MLDINPQTSLEYNKNIGHKYIKFYADEYLTPIFKIDKKTIDKIKKSIDDKKLSGVGLKAYIEDSKFLFLIIDPNKYIDQYGNIWIEEFYNKKLNRLYFRFIDKDKREFTSLLESINSDILYMESNYVDKVRILSINASSFDFKKIQSFIIDYFFVYYLPTKKNNRT